MNLLIPPKERDGSEIIFGSHQCQRRVQKRKVTVEYITQRTLPSPKRDKRKRREKKCELSIWKSHHTFAYSVRKSCKLLSNLMMGHHSTLSLLCETQVHGW
ncbi:hypothetical protein Peur_025859 [Populus x canadensis]